MRVFSWRDFKMQTPFIQRRRHVGRQRGFKGCMAVLDSGKPGKKTSGVLRYTWSPNTQNRNILELLDVEFVRNKNPENYFRLYRSSYNALNDLAKKHNAPVAVMDNDGNLNNRRWLRCFLNNPCAGIYMIEIGRASCRERV